jgi:predicted peroxiredoxin
MAKSNLSTILVLTFLFFAFSVPAQQPEKKTEAPKVASFLAAMGINAVRFHFLDSNRGADKSHFSSVTKNTRVLNPEQLDKLDYFVSELKNQGIYSNFNLNVGRTYREDDDVPFFEYLGMAKAATLFDERLIELQKEYAFQLLTHKNNYTGNEYRNEPALAFVETVNENSLVEAWFDSRLLGEHNSTKTSTWIDIPEY